MTSLLVNMTLKVCNQFSIAFCQKSDHRESKVLIAVIEHSRLRANLSVELAMNLFLLNDRIFNALSFDIVLIDIEMNNELVLC